MHQKGPDLFLRTLSKLWIVIGNKNVMDDTLNMLYLQKTCLHGIGDWKTEP